MLLGDAPRSVEYWVRGFEESGLAGLREGERSGRPGRLNEKHLRDINAVLLSVAAKKGTSLAVEGEPGVGLRSGLRWAQN